MKARRNDMLYIDFINKANNLTISQADNGLFYLEPMWFQILKENGLNKSDVSDETASWENIYETLKLEVEKRNTINSKKPDILNWLYEIITAQVEPAMLQEETDYIKQVTEFMKANHEKEDWEKFKNT